MGTLLKNQCSKCKGLGHWADGCEIGVLRPLQIGKDVCLRCNKRGHWAKDCPRRIGAKRAGHLMTPAMICHKWNRDTRSCLGECNLLHICSNRRCRRTTDRHPASHLQHRSD